MLIAMGATPVTAQGAAGATRQAANLQLYTKHAPSVSAITDAWG